jgi:hypothetical protein
MWISQCAEPSNITCFIYKCCICNTYVALACYISSKPLTCLNLNTWILNVPNLIVDTCEYATNSYLIISIQKFPVRVYFMLYFSDERYTKLPKFQAFVAMQLGPSLFCVVTQHRLVCCWHFVAECRFHLQGSRWPRKHFDPWYKGVTVPKRRQPTRLRCAATQEIEDLCPKRARSCWC